MNNELNSILSFDIEANKITPSQGEVTMRMKPEYAKQHKDALLHMLRYAMHLIENDKWPTKD